MDNTEQAVALINHYADNPGLAISEQLGEIAHLERVREMRRHLAEEEAKEVAKKEAVQPIASVERISS